MLRQRLSLRAALRAWGTGSVLRVGSAHGTPQPLRQRMQVLGLLAASPGDSALLVGVQFPGLCSLPLQGPAWLTRGPPRPQLTLAMATSAQRQWAQLETCPGSGRQGLWVAVVTSSFLHLGQSQGQWAMPSVSHLPDPDWPPGQVLIITTLSSSGQGQRRSAEATRAESHGTATSKSTLSRPCPPVSPVGTVPWGKHPGPHRG